MYERRDEQPTPAIYVYNTQTPPLPSPAAGFRLAAIMAVASLDILVFGGGAFRCRLDIYPSSNSFFSSLFFGFFFFFFFFRDDIE